LLKRRVIWENKVQNRGKVESELIPTLDCGFARGKGKGKGGEQKVDWRPKQTPTGEMHGSRTGHAKGKGRKLSGK